MTDDHIDEGGSSRHERRHRRMPFLPPMRDEPGREHESRRHRHGRGHGPHAEHGPHAGHDPHRHGPGAGFGRGEHEPRRHGPGPGFGPGSVPGPGFGASFGAGLGTGFGPGFGPEGPGPRGHRGGRRGVRRGARRGDVRAAVLALLAERPMHGYEVIQQIEERSGGRWRPSPGSVYPTLQMLADEGLVTGDESGGRRLFTLTGTGTAEAQKHAANAPWAQHGADPEWDAARQVRDELGQLGMAVMQVVSVGTDEQRAEILGAIADVRRRAYRLLADSPDVGMPVGSDDDFPDEDDVPPVPPAPATP